MKNKELLNVCYKFFNRYILADELIELLEKIDKSILSKEEIKATDDLIKNVKEIVKKHPNTVDEYVRKRKEEYEKILKRAENLPKEIEFLRSSIDKIKKESEKEIDSYERWFAVFNYINENEYFNACFDKLNDYELLEFIAQNIKASFPPKLSQEEFDRLVKVGIEKDEREWLWRLAFNYAGKNINYDQIVDYYIDKKDGYYLTELISAIGKELDVNIILEKIEDKDLIKDIVDRRSVIDFYVDDEVFDKFQDKLN